MGTTPLHLACMQWNTQLVNALIDAGADINAHDQSGVTPLLSTLMPHNVLAYPKAKSLLTGEERNGFAFGAPNNNATAITPFPLLNIMIERSTLDLLAIDGSGMTFAHVFASLLGMLDVSRHSDALALLEQCPSQCFEQVDFRGNTVLHLLCSETWFSDAISCAIKKNPAAVEMVNCAGMTPFMVFLSRATHLERFGSDKVPTVSQVHHSFLTRRPLNPSHGFGSGRSVPEAMVSVPTRLVIN